MLRWMRKNRDKRLIFLLFRRLNAAAMCILAQWCVQVVLKGLIFTTVTSHVAMEMPDGSWRGAEEGAHVLSPN